MESKEARAFQVPKVTRETKELKETREGWDRGVPPAPLDQRGKGEKQARLVLQGLQVQLVKGVQRG